jgi:oligopeptide transport system permease protein
MNEVPTGMLIRAGDGTVSAVLAVAAPSRGRDRAWARSKAGLLGLGFLIVMFLACVATLPWTLAEIRDGTGDSARGVPRYNAGDPKDGRSPPSWAMSLGYELPAREVQRLNARVPQERIATIAAGAGITPEKAVAETTGPVADALRKEWPTSAMGTDVLGRSLLVRVLTGGGISMGIGIAAAMLSVLIGTLYGSIAGYAGGRVDGFMMRIVDILYGLPYILLVVLLAVAVDALVEKWVSSRVPAKAAEREVYVERALAALPEAERTEARRATLEAEAVERIGTGEIGLSVQNAINVVTLFVAIGGVSWLTMARVVRGQVLSLKNQPFIEAARAIGTPVHRTFLRHLLPNLVGPIIVYSTLTVPQAILQESFLSFLGIGVKPPLPSWGNLAADGLVELNPYQSNWWLLLFPCVLLGTTLLALNFVGEGLREAFDPKRRAR